MSMTEDALDYLTEALQEHMRQIMEGLLEISHKRLEDDKRRRKYKICSNPKHNINELHQREKMERDRKDAEDRQRQYMEVQARTDFQQLT